MSQQSGSYPGRLEHPLFNIEDGNGVAEIFETNEYSKVLEDPV